MNKSELEPMYSIFGNKGAVWNNECHIAKSNQPSTLCGVPMLSSNWARIEDVQEIGCKKCLEIYEQETKPVEAVKRVSMFDMWYNKTITGLGSFDTALFQLFLLADGGNKHRIEKAFPEKFENLQFK